MAVRDVVQAAAGVGGGAEYVEDVFSTYLYTGNSSTQTITNGIDLDGEGGLVWIKSRGAIDHRLVDSERTPFNTLSSNSSGAQAASGLSEVSSFNSNGFTVESSFGTNNSSYTYASWTFRKASKFFDVVTYTGTGSATTIPHNLGSVPGVIIVKRTDSAGNWAVYHRSLTSANHSLLLNLTGAQDETGYFANTTPTDTVFSISSNSVVNASGGSYVAYLFAHDAGGFGDDDEQNVISCGSYVSTGANGNFVSLGFEPQWVIIKNASASGQWRIFDNMRGVSTGGSSFPLLAENATAEFDTGNVLAFNATGFTLNGTNGNTNSPNGNTYIYIAIRRPMKTPESGTEVFSVDNGNSVDIPGFISGFPVDMAIRKHTTVSDATTFAQRLTQGETLNATGTAAESANSAAQFGYMNGWDSSARDSAYYSWMFKRAPGFFDVVAYTGTGVAHTEVHNLGVAPELMIVKKRSNAADWKVYASGMGNTAMMVLNTTAALDAHISYWNNTSPTASVFTVGTNSDLNQSTHTYIAYLFSSLPGVSKVGSYSGTGSNVNVDCGFSAGARFILIKRTDASGDWYVWDSARGIVSGNDPYLLLNSTAAQVTNTDYIDPLASGFTVTSSAPAALNASGGSYIFLAIA